MKSKKKNNLQEELQLEARPFLKWAGGKGTLISQIDPFFPEKLRTGKIKKYIEPFIGGGALFLHVARSYPVEEFVIADANPELYIGYQTIKNDVSCLIEELDALQSRYLGLDEEQRQLLFYQFRKEFNKERLDIVPQKYQSKLWVKRTSRLIFLNHTCFNGLYRVNSKGQFNVPFGRYKRPKISNPANLKALSSVLQRAEILLGDFEGIAKHANHEAFVYFDPPYRPISKTARFNAYAKDTFDDHSQKRLAQFVESLHKKGVHWMLSNSDPKNTCPDDHFFDELYRNFEIERIKATRKINSKASQRGEINELIIHNVPIAETIQLPVRRSRKKVATYAKASSYQ